ncbi:tumor necrosis factor receptor superfamily member 1B [Brachyistius frenatus]|uniref:tumor necrosis factor receptor superfamily member 1B n=1 Tax=Brachyistius frenatus TaxID=100188 RepID=UPI0037E7A51C
MKDILILLVLLTAQISKVFSQPYQADSDGNCHDKKGEFWLDSSNLCCKKCHPGYRVAQECSETSESVCEPCGPSQYMESWNYSPNCFSCAKCRSDKGLQYAQNCSSTKRSKCMCQPGTYCLLDFNDPYCTDCKKYKRCRAGFGVSVPGKANSDVRCERCTNGTFSNTVSSIDPCRPHTRCFGRAVVTKGDATSDTVCERQPSTILAESAITPASTVMSTVIANSDSTTAHGSRVSTQSVTALVLQEALNASTKGPTPTTESDSKLAAVISGVIGFLLFFITLMLLFLCKRIQMKDSAELHPKVDANGNCESGDEISQNYLKEPQVTSFTVTVPERQYLLERGEASSGHSQCSNNTESLTRADGHSSHESISPLQSTLALNNPNSALSEPMTLQSTSALSNPYSALSEPMTLQSNMEPVTPQPTSFTQSSSQPTSFTQSSSQPTSLTQSSSQPTSLTQSSSQPTNLQITSPVTTSPLFNVNITLNIRNGSCGTSPFMPTDLMQADCELPFGEEEASFSTPQQEDGKQSLMSVQESDSFST